MSVIEDLLSSIRPEAHDFPVKDVLVGAFWTAVYSRRVGLAATPDAATCCFAKDVNGVGHLQERRAGDLVSFLHSSNPLEVSVGMAALNSLIEVDEQAGVELNARDFILARAKGKRVATIGHFPFSDALREVAAQTWVLELQPTPGDLPATAAPEVLPQADVIGLTASTLLNGTFENLHTLFPAHALVVMLGPSTPLSPVLFNYGVHVLGGALVKDPATALHYVGQGSTLHKVPGLVRFTRVKDVRLLEEV